MIRVLFTLATILTIATSSLFAQAPPAEDYTAARAKAGKGHLFLVTWVGKSPSVRVEGTLTATAEEFDGFQSGNVIISGPWKGEHKWYETMDLPNDNQVKEAVKRAKALRAEQVSQAAVPFARVWPLPSAGEIVDGDLTRRGPWPESLPFPEDMKRYKRAGFSQAIAVTNGRDTIDPVHRHDLPNKDWLQSGGMSGIYDFRSDLYRNDVQPVSSVGDIGVLNSFGYIQQNRGYLFRYPDGARFLDVLSGNAGNVFEVRQRLKEEGRWRSEVIYTDEKARPKGYVGLTKSCVSCHSQAGTGGYAVGLVPGSDGVLSVGFQDLELRGR